jgi:hypothetical protein
MALSFGRFLKSTLKNLGPKWFWVCTMVPDSHMPRYNAPFEIHVHGQVTLRKDANFEQVQDALKPLWKYAGARSLSDGAGSAYEDEPGIKVDLQEHFYDADFDEEDSPPGSESRDDFVFAQLPSWQMALRCTSSGHRQSAGCGPQTTAWA